MTPRKVDEKKGRPATTVDGYIGSFPKEVQARLRKVRAAVRKAAPKAEEALKYNMPAYSLEKNLVFFAAFANHIGFYGVPTGVDAFKDDFLPYKTGRGSIQFPFDRPLPLALITRIVNFRAKQVRLKATSVKKAPTKKPPTKKHKVNESIAKPRR